MTVYHSESLLCLPVKLCCFQSPLAHIQRKKEMYHKFRARALLVEERANEGFCAILLKTQQGD